MRAARSSIAIPARVEPTTLRLRRAKINGLLGASVPDADVKRILESLGFTLRDAAERWPIDFARAKRMGRQRPDAARRHRARSGSHRGSGAALRLRSASVDVPAADVRAAARSIRASGSARHLRGVMTAAGFSEAMTFGFVASTAAAAPFAPEGELVPIANPLSENFAVLRPSALPSLVDAVAHNRRREQRDVRLFEVGARFSRTRGRAPLAGMRVDRSRGGEHWSGGARDVDFFDIKGIVERIGEALRLEVTHGGASRELACRRAVRGSSWPMAYASACSDSLRRRLPNRTGFRHTIRSTSPKSISMPPTWPRRQPKDASSRCRDIRR